VAAALIGLSALLARVGGAQAPLGNVTPPGRADTGTAAPRPPAGTPRRVEGRVLRPVAKTLEPIADEWVTLHRVGSDTAGPIDSMRTRADGRFAFHYRTSGVADAVYFVSATYDGIAYLSQPLTRAIVQGAEADITVYDTTTRAIALRVQGRHLVVSAPAATGLRSVVEVFELSNDTSVTVVSAASTTARPTWSVALPPDAQRFQVGQGDVPPDAVTLVRHQVQVFAPFAPGLKQLSFSYTLPSSSFPLVRPLPTGAIVFESLLEEPRARVDAPRLREVAPVAVEGRTFRRYLAQDIPVNSVVRVTVPVVYANRRALYIAVIIIIIGVGMLIGLALAFRRRPLVSALAGTSGAP
jgi:hypothetical protein